MSSSLADTLSLAHTLSLSLQAHGPVEREYREQLDQHLPCNIQAKLTFVEAKLTVVEAELTVVEAKLIVEG